ncbi:MAG: hypothetical protein H6658_15550 [Ardenticatenaceae bacterium]|nr:hypothetical protein [Ardenticatenaceae bacterium]
MLELSRNGRWRTPEGIVLGGAGYFGYEVAYVPVEEGEWVRRGGLGTGD